MNLETYSYFIIILGGFGLVWSFRKGSGSQKEITDFEYLGFSAFWGVLLFSLYNSGYKNNQDKLIELFKNPYVAGAGSFMISILFGWIAGWLFEKIKSKMKKV